MRWSLTRPSDRPDAPKATQTGARTSAHSADATLPGIPDFADDDDAVAERDSEAGLADDLGVVAELPVRGWGEGRREEVLAGLEAAEDDDDERDDDEDGVDPRGPRGGSVGRSWRSPHASGLLALTARRWIQVMAAMRAMKTSDSAAA